MSTKIYNGFSVWGARTLEDALQILNTPENRAAVLDIIKSDGSECIAREFSQRMDRAAAHPENDLYLSEAENAYTNLAYDWRRRASDNSKSSYAVDQDYDVEVMLYPMQDEVSDTTFVLGTYHISHPKLNNWFTQQHFYQDFSYWDNTDRPEELSEEDWDRRRELWDKAIPTGTPAECGLMLQLSPPHLPFILPAMVQPLIKPCRTRAEQLARDEVTGEHYHMLQNAADNDAARYRNMWSDILASRMFADTPEGHADIMERAARYEPLLTDYTKFDLNGEPLGRE